MSISISSELESEQNTNGKLLLIKLRLGRALPVPDEGEIVLMSKILNIYLEKNASFRINDIVLSLKKRFSFEQLISYYESFNDEI